MPGCPSLGGCGGRGALVYTERMETDSLLPSPAELARLRKDPLWAPLFELDEYEDVPDVARKSDTDASPNQEEGSPVDSFGRRLHGHRFWDETWPALFE